MPQTPRPQPLTSCCALCDAEGFTDALDLHMHTTWAHYRPVTPWPVAPDEDFVVAE